MKKYLSLLLIPFLFGCSHKPKKPNLKQHLEKKEHRKVVKLVPLDNGQYSYHDDDNDIWFYLWLFNNDSGRIQYVYPSSYSPEQMGYSINAAAPVFERAVTNNPPAENEELNAEGQIESQDAQMDAEVDAANSQMDIENASAIESFENEGGNLGDTSESSADSGSSDSGGSDSGGGDSGGSD